MSALISPNRILDVLKESEKLKAGQKWMVIVTSKAEGMEDSPDRGAHKGSDAIMSVMKPFLSSDIRATGIRPLNER